MRHGRGIAFKRVTLAHGQDEVLAAGDDSYTIPQGQTAVIVRTTTMTMNHRSP